MNINLGNLDQIIDYCQQNHPSTDFYNILVVGIGGGSDVLSAYTIAMALFNRFEQMGVKSQIAYANTKRGSPDLKDAIPLSPQNSICVLKNPQIVPLTSETKKGKPKPVEIEESLPRNQFGSYAPLLFYLEDMKKIQNYEPKSNNSFNSVSITPSTSKISISSQSSAEKNQATQHVNPNKSQSQIPILSRNNSTSSFRDGSKNGSLKLISRSNTGASLFSNNSRTESPKIFKVDLAGRLVILSKNHPFLEKIKSGRKKIPQSYRDAIRIDNLTDNEMDDLSNNYVNKTIAVSKPSLKA